MSWIFKLIFNGRGVSARTLTYSSASASNIEAPQQLCTYHCCILSPTVTVQYSSTVTYYHIFSHFITWYHSRFPRYRHLTFFVTQVRNWVFLLLVYQISHIITYYHILSHSITHYHILSHIITYHHISSHIITNYHILSPQQFCTFASLLLRPSLFSIRGNQSQTSNWLLSARCWNTTASCLSNISDLSRCRRKILTRRPLGEKWVNDQRVSRPESYFFSWRRVCHLSCWRSTGRSSPSLTGGQNLNFKWWGSQWSVWGRMVWLWQIIRWGILIHHWEWRKIQFGKIQFKIWKCYGQVREML